MGIVSTAYYAEAGLCCKDDAKLLQVSFIVETEWRVAWE